MVAVVCFATLLGYSGACVRLHEQEGEACADYDALVCQVCDSVLTTDQKALYCAPECEERREALDDLGCPNSTLSIFLVIASGLVVLGVVLRLLVYWMREACQDLTGTQDDR